MAVPCSILNVDRSNYGSIKIDVTSVSNGDGCNILAQHLNEGKVYEK